MLSEILKHLEKYGDSSADQISANLGLNSSLLSVALEELVLKGRIVKNSHKSIQCGGCSCGCTSVSCGSVEYYSLTGSKNRVPEEPSC